jgi:hypothetical protein
MAHSQSETDADAATPPKPTYESGTLPSPDGDVAKRERRACEEPMVVIPAFDSWGYVPKNDPVYRTATASGSIYDVDPRSGDDCMDTRMNRPDNGCKHTRRVVRQLNDGALPAPDQSVEGYLLERVPAHIEQFAADYRRLQGGQSHPEADPNDYADPLAEVEHFLTVLGDAYRDYRDRVNEDAPPLAEQIESVPEPAKPSVDCTGEEGAE